MSEQLTNTAQWIDYRGKRILLADYSGVDMLKLEDEIKANESAIVDLGSKGATDLLILTDVSGCHIDLSGVNAFQSVSTAMKPYTKGSAVVGITGVRKILLDAVVRFSDLETKAFNNLEDAKDWLVKL